MSWVNAKLCVYQTTVSVRESQRLDHSIQKDHIIKSTVEGYILHSYTVMQLLFTVYLTQTWFWEIAIWGININSGKLQE